MIMSILQNMLLFWNCHLISENSILVMTWQECLKQHSTKLFWNISMWNYIIIFLKISQHETIYYILWAIKTPFWNLKIQPNATWQRCHKDETHYQHTVGTNLLSQRQNSTPSQRQNSYAIIKTKLICYHKGGTHMPSEGQVLRNQCHIEYSI